MLYNLKVAFGNYLLCAKFELKYTVPAITGFI